MKIYCLLIRCSILAYDCAIVTEAGDYQISSKEFSILIMQVNYKINKAGETYKSKMCFPCKVKSF